MPIDNPDARLIRPDTVAALEPTNPFVREAVNHLHPFPVDRDPGDTLMHPSWCMPERCTVTSAGNSPAPGHWSAPWRIEPTMLEMPFIDISLWSPGFEPVGTPPTAELRITRSDRVSIEGYDLEPQQLRALAVAALEVAQAIEAARIAWDAREVQR